MSIRFQCTACRTVMKVDSMITEEKKVRCTGCRIVILLTPDPDEPNGFSVSIPKKRDKPKQMSDSKKRILLVGALVIMAIIVGVGLFLTFRGPPTTGTVEGDVTLDNAPIKGTIEFEQMDVAKPIKQTAGISVAGRYSIRAGLGKNRVKITGDDGVTIPARYNTATTLDFDVNVGVNSKDFDLLSK